MLTPFTSVQFLSVLLPTFQSRSVGRGFHLEADLVALHVDVAQHGGALHLDSAKLKGRSSALTKEPVLLNKPYLTATL